MKDFEAVGDHLRYLDELAAGSSMLHQLHPGVKLAVTLAFVGVVASFSRYAILPMLPLVCYPMAGLILGELPTGYLLKRMLWAAPLVLMLGLFNPWLDRTPVLQLGAVALSGGWVSLIALLLKFALTVLAALILIATTGINQLGAVLQRWGLPRLWAAQLVFLYRYLFVLLEETSRTMRAYHLRAGKSEGVKVQAWGSLVGHLLLRTVDRAQRIYQAMLCRGYRGELRLMGRKGLQLSDGLFLGGWVIFMVWVRLVNLPQLIGDWGWRLFQ